MDTTAQTLTVPMNRKTRYYYNHRNDPVFQQRMREAKRRYYQKNREAVIQKSLDRYYAIKALNTPADQGVPGAETEPTDP